MTKLLIGGSPCFAAGTMVMTRDGHKPIERVRVGDEVLTHMGRYRRVSEVMSRTAEKLCRMSFRGHEAILCTLEHPFLTPEGEWVAARELAGGGRGVSPDGTAVELEGFALLPPAAATVYNLEVEEDHSYTANGMSVHNCNGFSRANARSHEREPGEGYSWSMFELYLRAKEVFKPDFFLFENVSSASPAVKRGIAEAFDCPHCATMVDLNAGLVSAQARRRIYVTNLPVSIPEDRHIALQHVLEVTPSTAGAAPAAPLESLRVHDGTKRGFCEVRPYEVVDMAYATTPTSSRRGRLMRLDGKAHTLCSQPTFYQYLGTVESPCLPFEGGRVRLPDGTELACRLWDERFILRPLTVRECARLQGMPEDWYAGESDAQALRQIGLGWNRPAVRHLLSPLCTLPRDERIVCLSMFDGVGTGRLILEDLGFVNIRYAAVEIDPAATAVLARNAELRGWGVEHLGDASLVLTEAGRSLLETLE